MYQTERSRACFPPLTPWGLDPQHSHHQGQAPLFCPGEEAQALFGLLHLVSSRASLSVLMPLRPAFPLDLLQLAKYRMGEISPLLLLSSGIQGMGWGISPVLKPTGLARLLPSQQGQL